MPRRTRMEEIAGGAWRGPAEVAGAGGCNARSAPSHNHEQGKWS